MMWTGKEFEDGLKFFGCLAVVVIIILIGAAFGLGIWAGRS